MQRGSSSLTCATLLIIQELQDSPQPRVTIEMERLLDAWNHGDPVTRQGLLRTLFDAMHIKGDRVTGYTPCADRRGDIIDLLEGAW